MKIKDANIQSIKNVHLIISIKPGLSVYNQLITKVIKYFAIEYKRLFKYKKNVNQRII